MKTLQYQERAVKELVEKMEHALTLGGSRRKIVLKAPTGSGKTVMMSHAMSRLAEEREAACEGERGRVAYVWIAPNELHQQSYEKLRAYFGESRLLRAMQYDEADHTEGYLHPGEVLFVNWQSINSENRLMVREREQGRTLYQLVEGTRRRGVALVCVVDECHLFIGNGVRGNTQSNRVLQRMGAKVEVLVSATPEQVPHDEMVTVDREEVVREQMIKRRVVLNPGLREEAEGEPGGGSLDATLLALALRQRSQLAEAYGAAGERVNPLLLVQLPNDSSASLTEDDRRLAEELKYALKNQYGIDEENGRLAVWLSNEKSNLAGIEREESLVDVLLFKQAIAMGWDCPRAAVLLIYRRVESFTFTMQTIGRIMRMPHQHHYADERLNEGYVFTNLSKDKIMIAQDALDYILRLHARRREEITNVVLPSTYEARPSKMRNRLMSDFRRRLAEAMNQNWLSGNAQTALDFGEEEEEAGNLNGTIDFDNTLAANRKLACRNGKISNFEVKSIRVDVLSDVELEVRIGVQEAERKQQVKFARTAAEIEREYYKFCEALLVSGAHGYAYEKVSLPTLCEALEEVIEQYFGLMHIEAWKLVLYRGNRPAFTELLTKVLADYYQQRVKKRAAEATKRNYAKNEWEVPPERYYNEEENEEVKEVRGHALLPFVRQRDASTPERRFEEYLEARQEKIEWWYKNGDKGQEHLAVPYEDENGGLHLFYVDFVVKCRDGRTLLIDTKSLDSDPNAPSKHNALLKYMAAQPEKRLEGGVAIEEKGVWWVSHLPINNTSDLTGWDMLEI